MFVDEEYYLDQIENPVKLLDKKQTQIYSPSRKYKEFSVWSCLNIKHINAT